MSDFNWVPLDEDDIDILELGEEAEENALSPLFKYSSFKNEEDIPEDEIITSGKIFNEVHEIIEMIKPYVKLDGGDVTFVGIRNNWALIKFSGNCSSCAAMPSTLIEIESSICDEIPSIEGIEVLQD